MIGPHRHATGRVGQEGHPGQPCPQALQDSNLQLESWSEHTAYFLAARQLSMRDAVLDTNCESWSRTLSHSRSPATGLIINILALKHALHYHYAIHKAADCLLTVPS